MTKHLLINLFIVLVAFAPTLLACRPDTVEIPAQELYTRDFIKRFGVTDPSRGWNSAMRVSASFDPAVVAGAEKVKIYTAWPGNPDGWLVADYPASERNFTFDFPDGADRAFVLVLDAEGNALFSSYVPIVDGRLTVGSRTSRAIVPTPLPYAFDLSANKALGSFPTDKNPAIERFWKNFSATYGLPIASGDDGSDPTPDYPLELTSELSLPAEVNDGTFFVELPNPNGLDLESLEMKITVRYAQSYYSAVAIHGGPDEGNCGIWLDQAFVDPRGQSGESVIPHYVSGIDISKVRTLKFATNNCSVIGVSCTQKFKPYVAVPDPDKQKGIAQFSDLLRLYGFTSSPQTTFDGFRQNYLRPNNTYDETGYSAADLVPIIGRKSGVFSEEIGEDFRCNLEKFREDLKPEDGVKYIVSNDNTEVSIDYLFGCASTFNSFGYIYCSAEEAALPDDERMAVLMRKPMFIIAYSANQGTNMLLQEEEGGPWKFDTDFASADIVPDGPNEGKDQGDGWTHCMRFSQFVQNAENGDYDGKFVPRFRSARYHLVYYSPDEIDSEGRLKPGARGSYKFPKGTNIAFFVITGGRYALEKDGAAGYKIDHRRIAFSRPVMNRYIGNTINAGHSHQAGGGNNSVCVNGAGEAKDWTAFVSYRWNGQRLMGVEDYFAENDGDREGGDHDMNDIIFRINGEFENRSKELNDDDDKKQSWIIACEDLGGSYDYDFNDVVFGVTHVNGSETATVTALAAGGTLPVYLHSKYPQLDADGNDISSPDGILRPAGAKPDGEFHSWWDGNWSHQTQINVDAWTGRGASVTIKVDKDFSLAGDDSSLLPGEENHMGGFKVIVKKSATESTVITPPKKDGSYEAPQMFLVPSKWFWPVEQQPIDEVYRGFIPWQSAWWTRRDGICSGNVIQHAWPTFLENNNKKSQ